jgi:hypothetical protein
MAWAKAVLLPFQGLDYRVVADAFGRWKSASGALCVKVFDNYFVVVLPLSIPFFVHVLDSNRVPYLWARQVPACKHVLYYVCCFGPTSCADDLVFSVG